MMKWIQILWPSFMVAFVATAFFFSVINPQAYYFFGETIDVSPIATYSIGFFGFWLACAGSSLISLYLTPSPDEVNRQ